MAKSAQTTKVAQAARVEPLAGRISGGAGVALAPAVPASRVSLRTDPANAQALSKALGLDLPLAPKTSSSNARGRMALWLGPDEWLIIDEAGDPASDLAKAKVLHSATDISHRNTAILVTRQGRAGDASQGGCPQNLGDTVVSGWGCNAHGPGQDRGGDPFAAERPTIRVECWRSFSDYAFTFPVGEPPRIAWPDRFGRCRKADRCSRHRPQEAAQVFEGRSFGSNWLMVSQIGDQCAGFLLHSRSRSSPDRSAMIIPAPRKRADSSTKPTADARASRHRAP
jgi:sarcosine oxidase subunit gamma